MLLFSLRFISFFVSLLNYGYCKPCFVQ
uniref:Uncharacterized protein n=1 Tax=Rhizophora mucronata TaxID=61149 RepID=A0A2P2NGX8_RHIMU